MRRSRAEPSILAKSYRSRPALVDLSSDLFAAALGPHDFPEAQVRLVAAKDDPPQLANQIAFEAWRWVPGKTQRDGKNVSAREAEAVAAGVEALLANPPTVRAKVDGADDRLRPAARRSSPIRATASLRWSSAGSAAQRRPIPTAGSHGGSSR